MLGLAQFVAVEVVPASRFVQIGRIAINQFVAGEVVSRKEIKGIDINDGGTGGIAAFGGKGLEMLQGVGVAVNADSAQGGVFEAQDPPEPRKGSI